MPRAAVARRAVQHDERLSIRAALLGVVNERAGGETSGREAQKVQVGRRELVGRRTTNDVPGPAAAVTDVDG